MDRHERLTDRGMERLLDSAVARADDDELTEDEQLAMLIWAGHSDWEDMLDYECD